MNREDRCRSTAFTLVEVVVGLVLMGTVLTAAIRGLANHREQIRLSDQRWLAAELTDDLLVRWSGSRGGVPVNASGRWPPTQTGAGVWTWQTGVIDSGQTCGVATRVVRVEVRRWDRRRLLSVDLLLPGGAIP